jgi:hypothetical protein
VLQLPYTTIKISVVLNVNTARPDVESRVILGSHTLKINHKKQLITQWETMNLTTSKEFIFKFFHASGNPTVSFISHTTKRTLTPNAVP